MPPAGAQAQALEIRSLPLVLKLDEPAATNVGHLRWRGGISMKANSASFGGWSDLQVAPDGRSLTSISDEGAWFTAAIDYDATGNLAGLSNAEIGKLRGLDGQPLDDKAWADAEGTARLPDGSWLVSFERHHRLWRYPTLTSTPVPLAVAPNNEPSARKSLPIASGGIATSSSGAARRMVATKVLLLGPGHRR